MVCSEWWSLSIGLCFAFSVTFVDTLLHPQWWQLLPWPRSGKSLGPWLAEPWNGAHVGKPIPIVVHVDDQVLALRIPLFDHVCDRLRAWVKDPCEGAALRSLLLKHVRQCTREMVVTDSVRSP